MSSAADVLIVGAGIAGCEAAWRCAHAGLTAVLVTTNLDTVYNLASPAAHLQPPADSLMERVVRDIAPSREGIRSWDLHRGAKYALEATPAIHLLQSTVSDLLLDERGAVIGASTWEGIDRRAGATALCVGSFLRARLHAGEVTETHGRLSEMAYDDLYERLVELGFEFVPVSFTGEPFGGSLEYVVETVAFAPGERGTAARSAAGQGTSSSALWRANGLFAAGVCASPLGGGTAAADMTYAAVARQGMALGDDLVAAHALR
ncbi:MAG TPA: FAD-dependent oxidoreductase [Trueperaceae bacterium]|nr:FAD-dependent oxidoreductase [Trueperaceae bacterium]